MTFRCLKDNKTFDIEKPKEIEGLWQWKGLLHCPYCGSEDLQEELAVPVVRRDKETLRRENKEMTKEAMQMAMEASAREQMVNPDQTLTPIQGAGKFGGNVKVKKSILDSLESKSPVNDQTI